MEEARIDYGFYTKKMKELLSKLQDQDRHLTQTLDEFSEVMRRCYEAKRILEGE